MSGKAGNRNDFIAASGANKNFFVTIYQFI